MSALMDYDFGDTMHGGGWVLMVVTMLVFWSLLVAVIVWLIRTSRVGDQAPDTRRAGVPTPESVLASRYARGEIDDDEFERRRAALERASAGL